MGRAATSARLLACATQLRIGLDHLKDWPPDDLPELYRGFEMLCQEIGPTVPKRVAARHLGVDVSSLDRWIAQDLIDTGGRPTSSRQEISTEMTIELALHMSRWAAQRPRAALHFALHSLWDARLDQETEREWEMARSASY